LAALLPPSQKPGTTCVTPTAGRSRDMTRTSLPAVGTTGRSNVRSFSGSRVHSHSGRTPLAKRLPLWDATRLATSCQRPTVVAGRPAPIDGGSQWKPPPDRVITPRSTVGQ
jgi:hypothetical protein